MINKFKKGGLNKSILAQILLLPKEQLQQIIQAFSQWALQKGVDIQQLQKDPNALELALGQFMQELQSQKTQAARHGAKLNYLKSLKNKCAEDEELVYFKKGGSIDCGCKKKEVGGKVLSAQNGAVAKFKNDKKTNQIKWTDKDEKKLDSLSTREGMNKSLTPQGKKDLKNLREKFKKSSNTKDYEVEEGKKGTKINKICGGSAISKFKAKCGSKLKKHQLGGSLNGIPFYLKGTNKGGIQVPGGRTQEEVDAINNQNKNNAKGLFKGMISGQIVPTLPNIGRMISSAYNGWVEPETAAITGEPTILPGKFPTIERLFGTKGGTYHILKKAPEIIKKMKLLTFMGNNGQQYVKTPDGKVQSLINYVGNIVEKDINTPYGKNMQKMLELEREKDALEVKNRFGTIGKLDHSLMDPAINLNATRGSINRVGRGKYSNRNAQTANDLELIESNLKRIPKGKKP